MNGGYDPIADLYEFLAEEVADELLDLCKKAKSAKELIHTLMVGNCPKCGSKKTRDTEGTKLDDTTTGICLDCGVMWCLECGRILSSWPCKHWAVCEECGFKEELIDNDGNRIEGAYTCEYTGAEEDCPVINDKLDQD